MLYLLQGLLTLLFGLVAFMMFFRARREFRKSKPRQGIVGISGTYANQLEQHRDNGIFYSVMCAISAVIVAMTYVVPYFIS